MSRTLRHITRPAWHLWFAGVLALVLASTVMAHRTAPTAPDPALTAFLAAGGTLGDLCRDHGGPVHDTQPRCEACRLFAAALMPPVQNSVPVLLGRSLSALIWPGPVQTPPRAPPSRHPPRAMLS